MATSSIYLASRSPRRRELLEQIGVSFLPVDVEVDERPRCGEAPADYVERLATEKATSAHARLARRSVAVLAADTTVILDGAILGKPDDATHALHMLQRLSGREHRVLTGVALATDRGCRAALSESRVHFRATTAAERAAYVTTGEPMDKAGGYAIQGRAAVFIEHLQGSYSGVMGLPLFETAALLADAGIAVME